MRLGVVIVAVGTLLLSGCTGDDEDPAPSRLVLSTSAAATPSAADDPPGTIACGVLSDVVRRAALMDAGEVDAIVTGAATADAPVADAAERLAEAYGKALEVKGAEIEPDAVADVSAAASDMVGVCSDSGLLTVG